MVGTSMRVTVNKWFMKLMKMELVVLLWGFKSRESSMSRVGLGIEAKRLFHLADNMAVPAANLVWSLERM